MVDPDKPDPPPRTYGFKPKEFERLNAPSSASPPAPSAQDLARLAGPVRAKPSPAAVAPKPGDPNDVVALLERNRQVEQHHGGDRVAVRATRSRRRRDFWLLLFGGNLGITALVLVLGPNAVTVLFGFAGLVMFTLGLTWIMWFVMGDY